MSNGKSETSTFEMETRESFDKILQAIIGLNGRFDKIESEQVQIRKDFNEFKNYVEAQFEAVRQGLVQNYQEILLLQRDTAENRMSNATIKSMVSELNERVYQMSRTTERSF